MPVDMRLLRFRFEEAITILRRTGPSLGIKVPKGRVSSCRGGVDKARRNVIFSFVDNDETLTLSRNDLIACLISYCQSHGVPLPRSGGKSIAIKPDCVELRIILKSLTEV